MNILVRRSNLLIPVSDAAAVREAWRHGADAITLDLVRGDSRSGFKVARAAAGAGGAEVFVRVSMDALKDDVAAAVCDVVRGIMLHQVASAADVIEDGKVAAEVERQHGMAEG